MTPEELFAAVADRPGAVWLDSESAAEAWSIVAWDPVERVTSGSRWLDDARALTVRRPRADVPFGSGVIGYVGYDPNDGRAPEPPVFLARYEGAACYRHVDRSWHMSGTLAVPAVRPLPPPPRPSGTVAGTPDPEAWMGNVSRIQEWIAAGDCYQVNLTRVVHVRDAGPPFAAYRRLRERPARYGAFLRIDERLAVLSNSPELLLSVRGSRLRSEPIKGTRPRAAEETADRALARELAASRKDRAELTMIVDLVRNDLGRVAQPGSVQTEERAVHSLPTVHHTWWPVNAELDTGRDVWDALHALFPPGSVTGAPKIRACQRIGQLESEPRGVYCGAIGYTADHGDAGWSVAIRVAVFDGQDARYHVGGGIVVDSDPRAEWDETVAKEAALRRALVA